MLDIVEKSGYSYRPLLRSFQRLRRRHTKRANGRKHTEHSGAGSVAHICAVRPNSLGQARDRCQLASMSGKSFVVDAAGGLERLNFERQLLGEANGACCVSQSREKRTVSSDEWPERESDDFDGPLS